MDGILELKRNFSAQQFIHINIIRSKGKKIPQFFPENSLHFK
jgi:hypothetical protein